LAQIRLVVFEKNAKTAELRHTSIPKNDFTDPKAIQLITTTLMKSAYAVLTG